MAAGSTHGFLYSFAARQTARDRAEKQALLGVQPELLNDVLPTSVERVKEDEDATRRMLEAWTLAAQTAALGEKAQEGIANRPAKARWMGWFSSDDARGAQT